MADNRSTGFIRFFLLNIFAGGLCYAALTIIKFQVFSTELLINPLMYYQPWFYLSTALMSASVILSIILLIKKQNSGAMGMLLASMVYIFATVYTANLYFNRTEYYESFSALKWKNKERSLKMARDIRDQDLLKNLNETQVIRKQGLPDDTSGAWMIYYLDENNLDCELEIRLNRNQVQETTISCDLF